MKYTIQLIRTNYSEKLDLAQFRFVNIYIFSQYNIANG